MLRIYYTLLLFIFSFIITIDANAYFIENKGQIVDQHGKINDDVLFIHQQNGLKVILTKSGFSYEKYEYELTNDEISRLINDEYSNPIFNIHSYRIDFEFGQNAERITPSFSKQDQLNYFGHKTSFTEISQYEKVTYFNIQNGIDIEFLITPEGQFKYNIIAHNFNSAKNLNIKILGSDELEVENNILHIHTPLGVFKEEIPMSYVNKNGTLNEVNVLFKLDNNQLSFKTPIFSNDEILIIDPQPEGVWGTYYGGSEYDISTAIATDLIGNVFHTGITMSSNIATSGAHEVTYQGSLDGFIAKYDTEGNLLWSSYYGGPQTDRPYGITTDTLGYVYVAGASYSEYGIATIGNYQVVLEGMDDIFVVKFNTSGIREWGTYVGGTGHDFVTTIKHKDSKLYLTGHTNSNNGISTPGTFLPNYTANETGYLLCLDDDGMNLLWGTYVGADMASSGEDIDIYNDFVYLGGRTNATSGISSLGSHQQNMAGFGNGFLQKFNNDGTLVWGTYYGGQYTDQVYGTALDNQGNIYIAGNASSTINISSPAAYQETRLSSEQGFLAKFNPDGIRQWGTYLGGTSSDYITSLTSADSLLIVGGKTLSTSTISTVGAYQETLAGDFDGFINCFSTSGDYLWGTYFGGELGEDISSIDVGINRNIYAVGSVSGSTSGIAFGNSSQNMFGGASSDGFVVKFCLPTLINISYNDGFLIASGADEYEWFLNGVSMGLFSDSINPPVDGTYTVEGSSDGNCVITSDEYIHSTINLTEITLQNSTLIYPNPISNSQSLTIESTNNILGVKVYDIQGKQVFNLTTENLTEKLSLDISSIKRGIYTVKILTYNNYSDNKLVIY